MREWLGKPGNWGKNYGWGAYQDPDDEEKNQGLKSTFYECEVIWQTHSHTDMQAMRRQE